MTRPVLSNRAARRLFLDRHALLEPPTGPARGGDLLALIQRLGFVQVDSINTVERAHHMILLGRSQTYQQWLLETVTHIYHHRAQLHMYLKLKGYPVDTNTLYN